MGKTKVLIIDDEKPFCSLIKMNLLLTGKFSVWTANDGWDGFKKARKWKPDIILLDVIMPKMGGLDTLKMLKEDARTLPIPVIMLSALTDGKMKIRAGSLYAENYITKPVTTKQLIEKIESALNIE